MSKSLEELALHTYKKNLTYLEKSQKNIYDKLAAYESAVDNGHYHNKYDLVISDDYFDVLELSSGNYLYGSNSKEYAEKARMSIDLKRDSNLFECFRSIDINHQDLDKYAQVDIMQNNLSGLAPILDYINIHKIQDSDLQKIRKFIFFGAGLGGHILSIDEKINANIYLIIEDDLELFRLSLFTAPYYKLAQTSKLLFSVFDTNQEFAHPASVFLDTDFQDNHYIKYFHMLSHDDEKLKQFHLKITSQSHNLFYYNAILEQYLRPIYYLKNGYNFLNILRPYTDSALGNKPVLVLAPGPSLHHNLKWLKQNHNRFITVAFSATLRILEREGISPDIVTHLDGLKESFVHFEKINSYDFLKDTSFIISARTQIEIVKKLNKENIFFFENGTSYKPSFGNLSAPCIGATSYLLLLALGVKELYLLGLDLALDSKTGSTHAQGHEYGQDLDLETSTVHEDKLVFKNSVISTIGNFKDSVYTTPNFLLSIDSIDSTSLGFKKEYQNVYNLNDGAHFKNTISKKIEYIDIDSMDKIDKNILKKEIHNDFKSNSSSTPTKDELTSVQKRFENALKTKELILNQQNFTFLIYEEYLDSLVKLIQELIINDSKYGYDLALIYQEYFRLISTFIFDFFNSKELNDKYKHANIINHLLCAQLLRIVDSYINEIDTTSKN